MKTIMLENKELQLNKEDYCFSDEEWEFLPNKYHSSLCGIDGKYFWLAHANLIGYSYKKSKKEPLWQYNFYVWSKDRKNVLTYSGDKWEVNWPFIKSVELSSKIVCGLIEKYGISNKFELLINNSSV